MYGSGRSGGSGGGSSAAGSRSMGSSSRGGSSRGGGGWESEIEIDMIQVTVLGTPIKKRVSHCFAIPYVFRFT